ncbi:MAG: gamma-glutamyl-gamma-aminobutyrate hydrolase family protein [Tannerella sp.]|jgi:microsomal dipeptidase-like Zn-dependent dipeptidase/gamma-glutamyl-gamma-aminobutyrate hydrolase PuuD|nr:gamma-glutamyl-gamma-aminobutyrate hydrolase family protein [Tannerella sp.]
MAALLDLNKKIDEYTSLSTERRPVIGISANRKEGMSCIAEPYFQSVVLAGGAPVLIPVVPDANVLTVIVKQLDGLILSGGGDIDPRYLGEEPISELGEIDTHRDTFDLMLLKIAFDHQVPIMGICRGHQLINVAFGGTLYQDIHARFSAEALLHNQSEPRDCATHTVQTIDKNSKLSRIFQGKDTIHVNSFHHQAVKDVAPEFRSTAVSPDGLNEAMEHPEYEIFGLQWHPEPMATNGNEEMADLFRYHIQRAKRFAEAKRLHTQIFTVDSHTDTPMIFPKTFDLGKKEGGKVNIPLMEEGYLDAVFMVAYIPQRLRDKDASQKATVYALERLSQVIKQEQLHPQRLGIARCPDDLLRLKKAGKKALFLGIENGYAIGKEIANLKVFKDLGVSYITLCHNGNNDICDSAAGIPEWNGLSPFGKEVVREMNRLGIMIDVSHASEKTFYDVLQQSRVPVIASHSSVASIAKHRRNLTDDQIKALAAADGVVQICLYKEFINQKPEKASLSDVVRHICYVVDLVGVDHVGIGSDFDGDGEVIGCRSANELIQITIRLLDAGFTLEDIGKIWGGNLLRVMRKSQKSGFD